jgi:hypothetical protein
MAGTVGLVWSPEIFRAPRARCVGEDVRFAAFGDLRVMDLRAVVRVSPSRARHPTVGNVNEATRFFTNQIDTKWKQKLIFAASHHCLAELDQRHKNL